MQELLLLFGIAVALAVLLAAALVGAAYLVDVAQSRVTGNRLLMPLGERQNAAFPSRPYEHYS